MNEYYRPTRAEVKLNYIFDNYVHVQNHVGNKVVIPVVKANAYGHGSHQVVDYFYRKGIRLFAVSLLEEALELRNNHKDIDIIVMGMISEFDLAVVAKNNIIFTVYDERFANIVQNSSNNLRFHVKVDTGMNRLGIKKTDDLFHFIENIKGKHNLVFEGIFTHFATSDSNKDFHHYQLKRFREIIKHMPYLPKMIHVSNSSSTMKYEEEIDFTTHVRVGILLYGLTLDRGLDFLKPAMCVKTKVMHIKEIGPGEFVSYNITYEASKKERIAILPIGYADGLIRKNQSGFVEINSKKYPIIGRICMDQTIIKIDNTVNIGDDVIIIGGNVVNTDEVAKRLDTINYEVVTQIGARVPRVYLSEDVDDEI